jgi:Flp pilus assembly protein TadG
MKNKKVFLGFITQGQTLIEFAFVLPVLLLLLLGFFDLGRALFYYSSLSNAVREGTRSGIVMKAATDDQLKSDIKLKVLEYGFGLTTTTIPLQESNITVNFIPDVQEPVLKGTLQISADFCFVPVTPFISNLIGSSCGGGKGISLNSESLMLFEPGYK